MNNPYLTPDPTGLSPLSTPDFGAAFTSAMSSATNAVEGFVNSGTSSVSDGGNYIAGAISLCAFFKYNGTDGFCY
jgi:hypothetical protein